MRVEDVECTKVGCISNGGPCKNTTRWEDSGYFKEDSSDPILIFTKNGTEYHYTEAIIKLADELCCSKDRNACEKCPLSVMYDHKEYDCDDILEDYKLYNYKEV